ncbi:hypothetical protein FHR81_002219 [Actinoalloteichus hoggarensis]|uniref:alpha/beta fold hydrolase n=1 Tax=Actinoalloteichus hoggarensis TaxID=1470176 RepID=UPI00146FA8C8|nr:hypothetical protein [Actinoalloteichus hoggarensis]MBB5921181.1 hypothetical protein [Actinoalloteichus hoggarensis]
MTLDGRATPDRHRRRAKPCQTGHRVVGDSGGGVLHVERPGTGPALLMIAGGDGDAGCYSAVADRLADACTVLIYDRRGHPRGSPRGHRHGGGVREQLGSDHRARGGGPAPGGDPGARRSRAAAHRTTADAEEQARFFAEVDRAIREEGTRPAFLLVDAAIGRPGPPAPLRSPTVRRRTARALSTAIRLAGGRAARRGPSAEATRSACHRRPLGTPRSS